MICFFTTILLLLLTPFITSTIFSITTCKELQNINNNLIGEYILKNDIDCTGLSFYPIATSGTPFRGILSGSGYKILNLTINRPYDSYVGLFSTTSGATISQLSLWNVNISGLSPIGSLIGQMQGTVLTDIQIQGGQVTTNTQSISATLCIGGLIGRMGYACIIQRCFTTVSVNSSATSNGYVGGLIGQSYDVDSSIMYSYATGSVIGGSYSGGLIGYIGASISISDCFATGTVVTSSNYVVVEIGGLIGSVISASANDVTILRCYATGSVTITSTGNLTISGVYAGGLIGYCNPNSASITTTFVNNSYASGSLSVDGIVNTNLPPILGGLIGRAYTNLSVINSYATGLLTGTPNQSFGGLIGMGGSPQVTNSYWDKQSTNQTNSSGGTGYTTAQMYQQSSYLNWDFINTWQINNGQGYPWLAASIGDCDQLQSISKNLAGFYRLNTNLDCSLGLNFIPIGTSSTPFTGSLDGNGYTISNLLIQTDDQNYVGVFGYTKNAKLINLNIKNIYVNGSKNTGGLIGYATDNTLIANVWMTGNIISNITTASDSVGGIVGYLTGNSMINNSVAAVNINIPKASYVGGLVGQSDSQIINSYSLGNVNGATYAGGLIGANYGVITNTYSTGKISASSSVGGLCAQNTGVILSSYWDTSTSGQSNSAGGLGKTTNQMYTQSTYTGWDFITIWNIVDGFSYPWLRNSPTLKQEIR